MEFTVKELFPDWKIQEKWISITLRGRTCIVFLKKDSNHKFDYKQECIFNFKHLFKNSKSSECPECYIFQAKYKDDNSTLNLSSVHNSTYF